MRRTEACLLVWTNILAEYENDFNEWYSREHLRSRVAGLPGMLCGRRFASEIGGPRYAAFYEAYDPAAFSSPQLLALVARPDPLSRRFIPNFRDVIRVVGRTVGSAGADLGGTVGIFAFDAAEDAKPRMRHWLAEQLPQQVVSMHGIFRAQTFETDRAVLGASVQVHMRTGDRVPDFFIVIEGALPQDVDVMRSTVLRDADIVAQGGQPMSYARSRLVVDIRPE